MKLFKDHKDPSLTECVGLATMGIAIGGSIVLLVLWLVTGELL